MSATRKSTPEARKGSGRSAKPAVAAKPATVAKAPVKQQAKASPKAAPAKKSRKITVEALARVEGEGALDLRVRGDKVTEARLRIYEPPRFFEAFLRGRKFTEAPDITARICGICPIAYQMSSCHAMEQICGVTVGGQLRALRRLIYCGEWIESHALHVYLLHAPDFLGYQSAIHMAADHVGLVQQGLELKKVGNDLMDVVGGRSVHPVNVRVGGFYRAPSRAELSAMVPRLERALELSLATAKLTSTLPFPDFTMDYEFMALRHPDEYPLNEGRLATSRGLDIPLEDYEKHFAEEHVAHSNALQGVHSGKGPYHVGPLARYNLNFDRLGPAAREAAALAGLGQVERNPFKSIAVRAVELAFACEEALRIIAAYEEPETSFVPVVPREGVGYGCTEAPRGICFHRYKIDAKGDILEAKIVPPTSQNQKQIEADLVSFAEAHLDLSDEKLTWVLEQAIRNYDPCISCATHFLKLRIARE